MENSKEYFKAYREANREKLKAYREANREKLKAYKKAYNKENKEKLKQYRIDNKESIQAYAKANKHKIKGYRKKYFENNKEKVLADNKKRYASKKEAVDNVSDFIVNSIYQRVIAQRDPHYWAHWFPVREEKGRFIWIWAMNFCGIRAENELDLRFSDRSKSEGRIDIGVPAFKLFIESKRNFTTCGRKQLREQMKSHKECLDELVEKNIIPSYTLVAHCINDFSVLTENMLTFGKGLKRFFMEQAQLPESPKFNEALFTEIMDEIIAVCQEIFDDLENLRKLAGK